MNHRNWQTIFVLFLLAATLVLYLIYYIVIRDVQQTLLSLVSNLASVTVYVLLVTLTIDRVLRARERQSLYNKLNMVIGAFFSEVGTPLLKSFFDFDLSLEQNRSHFILPSDCSARDLTNARRHMEKYDCRIVSQRGNLEELRAFLVAKRDFLLRLLENPNLLEHESFTELLWAVLHLAEELSYRDDVKQLPESDYAHLSSDIKRAYTLLLREWLGYMQHLRSDYPYLFSLALRMNPFDPNASPEVK